MMHVRVEGFHGCPFFNTALQAAKALLESKTIAKVTVVRAGQLHVPKWTAPSDLAAWEQVCR